MENLNSAVPEVRRFEKRDCVPVAEIARQSPQAAEWSEESYRSFDGEGQFAWVAESSSEVCGFLIARRVAPGEAEILNLAVSSSRRRQGVATALLRACLQELLRAQVHSVFLEVRESNQPAIAFYAKENFVRSGRRSGYYRNPSEAAVLLVRKLTA